MCKLFSDWMAEVVRAQSVVRADAIVWKCINSFLIGRGDRQDAVRC
jgi:hypothetical protein